MPLYPGFHEITLNSKLIDLAVDHAVKRTSNIVRQFVPANAPLTPLESNFCGVIGEIAVRKYFGLNTSIDDNYDNHQVDSGDLEWKSKVYDVKTDAIPSSIYRKLYNGVLKNYETYGCRVFSAKHLHHLKKYSGGIIFCAFEIPDNAKATKPSLKPDHHISNIRSNIYSNKKVLIIGFIEQMKVAQYPPTWYTPMDPIKRTQSQYNSPNYIFHHSKLHPINKLS